MADSGIGLGDFPAWLALAVSLIGGFRQWASNKKNKRDLESLEEKTKLERIKFQQKIRIEQLSKDLDELCALSLEHWMKPGTEIGCTGLVITQKTKDISSRIWSYKKFLWPAASSEFSNLKRLITGGNFQSLRRPAEAHDSSIIRGFMDSFSDFREKLRIECDRIDIQ